MIFQMIGRPSRRAMAATPARALRSNVCPSRLPSPVSTKSAPGDGRLQAEPAGYQVKVWEQFCAEESHRPEAQSASGTCARGVPVIPPKRFLPPVGDPH